MWATRLVEADAVEEVLEAGGIPQEIKVGMHLKKLQNVGLLFISPLQPRKGLFVVTETQICVHKSASRNVTCLTAALQFGKELERISAASSVSVSSNQNTDDAWAAVVDGSGLLQYRNGVLRLTVSDE